MRRTHIRLGLVALVSTFGGMAILTGCLQLEGTHTEGEGSPPDVTTAPSLGKDIQPILDKNCSFCHRAGGIAEKLGVPMHLTGGAMFANVVNVPSSKRPDLILVVPGDPDNSLLFRKVADELPPVGFRMPIFNPPLSPEEIELIRLWIADGAPQN